MKKIKEIINKIKTIYKDKKLNFYFSLSGSLIMGLISLINVIRSFSFIPLFYALFSFSLAFIKIMISLFKKKDKDKGVLLFGSISVLLLSIPLVFSMVLTILYKDKPVYLFFWIIYAYATYATIKIITSSVGLNKAYKSHNNFSLVNSYFSFLSALYTIQMTQFALIKIFDNGDDMFLIQLFTQGAIFFIAIFFDIKLLII